MGVIGGFGYFSAGRRRYPQTEASKKLREAYRPPRDLIGLSPLDPKLPEIIQEWQDNVKEARQERYEEIKEMRSKGYSRYSKKYYSKRCDDNTELAQPIYVDCPNCGEKVDIFENASKSTATHN